MHPPYHLYEFTEKSFRLHAERAGYAVAYEKRHVGTPTFLPGPDPLWARLMESTDTGMQLEVWLRVPESEAETTA
jgi:hypothetical protein